MKLDLLPRGITGFSDAASELPRVDPKLFKAACHVAARDMRASIGMFEDKGHAGNYFAAIFDAGGAPVAALCNRIHPYLGFVPADTLPLGQGTPVFLPCPSSSEWAGFFPLDPDFLNADLQPDMLAALAPCELSQIRYWKPGRVGDVIFNFWD